MEDEADIRRCAILAYAPYLPRMGRAPAPMTCDFTRLIAEGKVFVAKTAADLAGFIVCYQRDDHLHIENIAVLPAHHGKGFGTVLMRFAETHARQLNLKAIELYTNEKMTENLGYYPLLGYLQTGQRREHGFARVFFRKQL